MNVRELQSAYRQCLEWYASIVVTDSAAEFSLEQFDLVCRKWGMWISLFGNQRRRLPLRHIAKFLPSTDAMHEYLVSCEALRIDEEDDVLSMITGMTRVVLSGCTVWLRHVDSLLLLQSVQRIVSRVLFEARTSLIAYRELALATMEFHRAMVVIGCGHLLQSPSVNEDKLLCTLSLHLGEFLRSSASDTFRIDPAVHDPKEVSACVSDILALSGAEDSELISAPMNITSASLAPLVRADGFFACWQKCCAHVKPTSSAPSGDERILMLACAHLVNYATSVVEQFPVNTKQFVAILPFLNDILFLLEMFDPRGSRIFCRRCQTHSHGESSALPETPKNVLHVVAKLHILTGILVDKVQTEIDRTISIASSKFEAAPQKKSADGSSVLMTTLCMVLQPLVAVSYHLNYCNTLLSHTLLGHATTEFLSRLCTLQGQSSEAANWDRQLLRRFVSNHPMIDASVRKRLLSLPVWRAENTSP